MTLHIVPAPRASPTRHLVLVYTPGWQDSADFHAIARHIAQMAPDIRVFVANNDSQGAVTRKQAATRPTLVFSPIRLNRFTPLRGRVFAGQAMSKLTEMARLAAAGLPVPRYEEIRPETRLSADDYGAFTVIKPSHAFASWGQGITLMRTEEVRYQPPEAFPPDHPGRKAPMVAQRFVDCGHAMSCRVLTLFGTTIFTYCRRSRQPLDLAGRRGPFVQEDFMPATAFSDAFIARDPDMLALAAAAYAAMPEIPLQACDILRDANGALHLLEINPGGGAWVFSNANAQGYRGRLGVSDLGAAFDAMRTCARVLIAQTRALAE